VAGRQNLQDTVNSWTTRQTAVCLAEVALFVPAAMLSNNHEAAVGDHSLSSFLSPMAQKLSKSIKNNSSS